MPNGYAWVLAFHLIGVMCWFAGTVGAGRLMASEKADSNHGRAVRLGLARHFLYGAAVPGAVLAITCGATMLYLRPEWMFAGWLRAKLVLVAIVILADIDFALRLRRHDAAATSNYRFLNAVLGLYFVAVILAAVKPF